MIGKPTRQGVTRLVAGAAVAAASMFTVGMALASPAGAAVTTISAAPAASSYAPSATGVVDVTYNGTPTANGTTANTGGLLFDVTAGADATDTATRCADAGSGAATCSLKNNGTATSDTVRVFDDANQNGSYDSGEQAATATLTFAPAYDAISLTCSSSVSSNEAHSCTFPTGTASSTFTAQVTNGGQPVAGELVTASATNGATVSAPARSSTNGTVTITVTPATTTSSTAYSVTATGEADGASGGTAKSDTDTVTYADRTATTLSLTPPTQTKVTGGSATLTATVEDQFGSAVTGESVDFAIQTGGRNAATGATRSTNSAGTATFTYIDNPTHADAYTDTVEATAEGGDLGDQATVNWLTSTTPDTVDVAVADLGGSCDPVDGDNTATTTASTEYAEQTCFEVVNSDDQVLADQTVKVSVDKGFVGSSGDGTATTTTVNVTTNQDGVGTAYVGSAVSGVQTITATDGTASGTASVTYAPGEASSVVVAPDNATITPGSAKTYTATVSDDLGNGVPDQTVTFSLDGPGVVLASTQNGQQGGATATTTTNASGVATVSLQTRSDEVGKGTISAAVGDSDLTDDATYFVGQILTTVTAYVPPRTAGQSDYVGSHALDQNGQAMSGVQLTFTITGANPSTKTITTGSDGTATDTFTATHAGAMTVKVAGPKGSPSVTTTSTVSQIQAKTTLKLASASKGKVTATATVSPTSLAGQIVGFYTVVGSKVTYVGQARIGTSNHAAILTFSGLKSGAKVSYEARVVGNTDVNSPFSNVAGTTVK